MWSPAIRSCLTILALALPLLAVGASADSPGGLPPATANAGAEIMAQMQMVSPQAIADYRRKLKEYQEARAAFEQRASAYWASIAEKRHGRYVKRRDHQPIVLDDYVLTQPPVYTGPKRPVSPLPEAEPHEPRPERKYVPIVADLLKAAAEYFQWTPQQPANDMEFKRAYARFASAAGLTREQAVRIYAFETGGNGTHASQSGFHGTRAISTAIGYNQLLTTNSVELLAEQGESLIKVLTGRAAHLAGAPRKTMDYKIAVLKKMVALARSVPDDWSQHEKIGDTPQGWALHAMVLDIDVGPMLQTQKLLTSVIFARTKGYTRPLTAAELEMMNLTGDGTGLDMVTMPLAMREQVPTANFFQRSGYERNPVAIHYNTVAKLLAVTDARMDANSNLPGARDLAAAF
jgi:hypothetical protein